MAGESGLASAIAAAAAIPASAATSAVAPSAAAIATTITATPATVSIAAAGGHGWDWGRQVGAALGVDDQVTLGAFAVRGGFHVFHIAKGHVQEAAFPGVGGREAVRLT